MTVLVYLFTTPSLPAEQGHVRPSQTQAHTFQCTHKGKHIPIHTHSHAYRHTFKSTYACMHVCTFTHHTDTRCTYAHIQIHTDTPRIRLCAHTNNTHTPNVDICRQSKNKREHKETKTLMLTPSKNKRELKAQRNKYSDTAAAFFNAAEALWASPQHRLQQQEASATYRWHNILPVLLPAAGAGHSSGRGRVCWVLGAVDHPDLLGPWPCISPLSLSGQVQCARSLKQIAHINFSRQYWRLQKYVAQGMFSSTTAKGQPGCMRWCVICACLFALRNSSKQTHSLTEAFGWTPGFDKQHFQFITQHHLQPSRLGTLCPQLKCTWVQI